MRKKIYYKEIDGKVVFFTNPLITEDGKQIFNPTETQLFANDWKEWIQQRTLEEAKSSMIANITDYDVSSSVNSFILNGKEMWFNRDTRTSIMNSLTILQQIGKETMNLWYDGTKYVIPCDILTQMLQTIEQYAILCFNVTEEHKAEVKSLTTIEEVDSYDYTTGYPEKLSFVV